MASGSRTHRGSYRNRSSARHGSASRTQESGPRSPGVSSSSIEKPFNNLLHNCAVSVSPERFHRRSHDLPHLRFVSTHFSNLFVCNFFDFLFARHVREIGFNDRKLAWLLLGKFRPIAFGELFDGILALFSKTP